MGGYISNMVDNLNINDNTNSTFFPGTKFLAKDDNTYIFLGYSFDINNLICIKDDNKYNGLNTYTLSTDDIKKIVYKTEPQKNNTNYFQSINV
jgi:hypothetical protein